MHTETQLPRRSISLQTSIRAVVIAALFALASAVTVADQPPAPATRVAKVSLAGLDLSTPEGKRAAYERIRSVVERLCFQLWDDPHREIYDACVHETLGNAVRRMNAPVLAASQESRTAP
jgi:UrcA family protein